MGILSAAQLPLLLLSLGMNFPFMQGLISGVRDLGNGRSILIQSAHSSLHTGQWEPPAQLINQERGGGVGEERGLGTLNKPLGDLELG